MNLLSYYGLDHAWNKFCNNKKLKEELSAFMPNLPGNIDAAGHKDGSSLRQLIEKPPICGKEILPLGSAETVGFRLLPGSIPEEYRTWSVGPSNAADKKKRKRKHENILGEEGPEEDAEKRAKRLKKEEERREKKKKKKDKKRKKMMETENPDSTAPTTQVTDFLNF
ncbi:hypothetical protein M514_11716, partial [Trichuris suis]